jgi:hypothetical protein
MTDIEVTQADRDAVRSWASFTTDMTMSTDDYADLVRAFARHRLEGQSKLVEALKLDVQAQEALQDGAYKAGMKAGWDFAQGGDESGYQRAMSSTEHVAELRRIKIARAALKGQRP